MGDTQPPDDELDPADRHGARRAAALAGLGMLSLLCLGCAWEPRTIFVCHRDQHCALIVEAGRCEGNRRCTVPDRQCESGRRWVEQAELKIASQCWDGDDVAVPMDGTSSATGAQTLTAATATTSEGGDTWGTSTGAWGHTETGSSETTTLDDPQSSTTDSPSTGTTSDACVEVYGSAPTFELCREMPDRCEFSVVLEGSSCSDLCAFFGHTCLDAYLNAEPGCIRLDDTYGHCEEIARDQICVCSL